LVNAMSISVGDPTFIIRDAKQIGLYVQDDWKVMRRLTLNLGMRWDKEIDFVGGSDIANSRTFEELQKAAPFSTLAASLVAKKAGDYSNGFSPRVGFAYDLTGHGNHVVRGGFGMYYDNTFQNIPLFMEQQSNSTIFQQAFSLSPTDTVPGTGLLLNQWAVGSPAPTIPVGSPNLLPQSVGRLMDPNYRTPVTEEFNGGYTWQINNKSVIEAEYVHVLGLHLNKTINVDPNIPVNPANIQTINTTENAANGPACTPLCGFSKPLDAAFLAAGVPVLGSVRDEQSIGRSRYDGLNISFRQRGFHKTDLTVNYTLARSMAYSDAGTGFRNYPRDPQNPFSPFEYGPTFNDERHHLTLAGTAHLPWGMDFSPILQFGSARPYPINAGSNLLNLGGGSLANALVVPNSDPNNLNFFPTDTSAHIAASKLAATQCYYAGNCHVAPFETFRGDPYFDIDMRLAKNIKVREHMNLQLAFQAFNLTSRANYGNNFGENVSNSSFGKPIGFINPNSTALARAFVGEFGARFTF